MGFDPGLAVAPVLPGAGKPMEEGVGTATQAGLLFDAPTKMSHLC